MEEGYSQALGAELPGSRNDEPKHNEPHKHDQASNQLFCCADGRDVTFTGNLLLELRFFMWIEKSLTKAVRQFLQPRV